MFLDTAYSLAQLLNLERVVATHVSVGDIVVHHKQVVHVQSIEPLEWAGEVRWLTFAEESASYDGYVRKMVARPTDMVQRVPRPLLKEPNDAAA